MSGQTDVQVVKMKLSTTGRPSSISLGSETLLPSSRTRVTAGVSYTTVDLDTVVPRSCACSDSTIALSTATAGATTTIQPAAASTATLVSWRPARLGSLI